MHPVIQKITEQRLSDMANIKPLLAKLEQSGLNPDEVLLGKDVSIVRQHLRRPFTTPKPRK